MAQLKLKWDRSELGNPTEGNNATYDKDSLILKGPPKSAPFIFKPVVDERFGKFLFTSFTYTNHTIPGESWARKHVNQKHLGEANSPEAERFWDIVKQMKELKNDGREKTEEYKVLEVQRKLLSQDKLGWLTVVSPGDSKFRALKLNATLINLLFGKAATKDKPAIPSLVEKMTADGRDPYDLTSDFGWLRYYKEGEKMATKHTVEEATEPEVVLVKGKNMTIESPISLKVHVDVLTATVDKLPDYLDFEKRTGFTYEESVAYAETLEVPQRVIDQATRKGGYEKRETVDENISDGDKLDEAF